METERISSGQNPKIKRLLALQEKSSLRRESGLFVVEGRRELEHCLAAGFEIDSLFVCPELLDGWQLPACGANAPLPPPRSGEVRRSGSPHHPSGTVPPLPNRGCYAPPTGEAAACAKVFELPEALYRKVAYRGGTEGVLAEVRAKPTRLEDLQLRENPLVVVLEAVEKPGNLGAVLRSADAAGADAVLVCDPLTDLWNPNLIRASIGAVFTVPVAVCTSAEAISWLKERGIRILTAQLQDSSSCYDTDMRGPTALVMGTESTGLSEQWRKAADAHIRIPMRGRLDSLNVSVSTAVLLFEAVRQRG